MKYQTILSVLAVGMFLLPQSQAVAEESSSRWKIGELSVGGYQASFDSGMRADSALLGLGTNLDFESDLNLDEEVTSVRVDGYWRFFGGNRIEVSFYDISRAGSRSITQDIEFDGTVFSAGGTVQTDIDHQVYKATYAYSLLRTKRWDGAFSWGMYGSDVSVELKEEIAGIGSRTESVDFFAPLPVFGGRIWYAFAKDFTLKFDVDLFSFDIAGFDGAFVDAKLALDYDLTDWFGVTLAYNYVDFDVDVDAGGTIGTLDYQYDMIILSGRLFF